MNKVMSWDAAEAYAGLREAPRTTLYTATCGALATTVWVWASSTLYMLVVVVAMEERPPSRHLGCMRSIFATVLNRGLGPFAQDLNAAEHRPTSTRPIRSGFWANGYSCAVTFACGFCGGGPCEQSTGLPQTQTRSSLALQWQWSRAAGQLAALDGAGEVLGLPPRGHEQGGPNPPRWIGL